MEDKNIGMTRTLDNRIFSFIAKISEQYDISVQDLRSIWNETEETKLQKNIVGPEQTIDFSRNAITDTKCGMRPSVPTIEQVMEHICGMDNLTCKMKLDLSDNWLHVNGAAIAIEQVVLKLPYITHLDLRYNRIEITEKDDAAAAKRLRKAIRRLITRENFVQLDLSENSFCFSWYYKLHKYAQGSIQKVVIQYS